MLPEMLVVMSDMASKGHKQAFFDRQNAEHGGTC